MTGAREEKLIDAANLLLNARRTGVPVEELPEALRPETLDEAYFVQDRVAEAYGTIGGWKVGATSPEATPVYGPMPMAWMASNGAEMAGVRRLRGLEAEIAFLLGTDLPPRGRPYGMEEVTAAIASCHPAIEVIESGLLDPLSAAKMSMFADLQIHGGFVFGPAVPGWESIDFATEAVTIAVDGAIRVERTGSNTSGNLMRLLPWLASEGSARTGGLKAGQWITTGSWTGVTFADSASAAHVRFHHAGEVTLRFA
ncbi:MAG: fumarylacetoacetate hydrolase family protein [Acidobacteriota bacterium]|nr:fumarylacetoacetate hydrolase family protein [Acidobacteriota bacterium]